MTVRITNYSKESVTISGLDQKTSELLSGAVSGTQWFRVQDGVAEFRSTLEPLPNLNFLMWCLMSFVLMRFIFHISP